MWDYFDQPITVNYFRLAVSPMEERPIYYYEC